MSEEAGKAKKTQYNINSAIDGIKELGTLKPGAEDGYRYLLMKLQDSGKITRSDAQAYTLETVYWETDRTMKPIREYDNKAKTYLKSRKYWPFVGMGYSMITWEENYRKFGKALGIDLVGHPEKAMEPEIAWQILEEGMTDMNLGFQDPEFTKYTLEQFFNEDTRDFYNARKIINPKDYDSFKPIGDRAEMVWKILEANRL